MGVRAACTLIHVHDICKEGLCKFANDLDSSTGQSSLAATAHVRFGLKPETQARRSTCKIIPTASEHPRHYWSHGLGFRIWGLRLRTPTP